MNFTGEQENKFREEYSKLDKENLIELLLDAEERLIDLYKTGNMSKYK